MQLTLEVAPYIAQYLISQFGVGPYNLRQNRDLLAAFMYFDLKARGHVPEILVGETKVTIVLEYPEHDRRMRHIANQVKATPIRHTFFVTEFWQCAISYVAGQMDAAGISRWCALENFLDRCGITEDIYPIETAYRMLTRYMQVRPYTLEPRTGKKVSESTILS